METTIVYWSSFAVVLRLCWDDGKEHGKLL